MIISSVLHRLALFFCMIVLLVVLVNLALNIYLITMNFDGFFKVNVRLAIISVFKIISFFILTSRSKDVMLFIRSIRIF